MNISRNDPSDNNPADWRSSRGADSEDSPQNQRRGRDRAGSSSADVAGGGTGRRADGQGNNQAPNRDAGSRKKKQRAAAGTGSAAGGAAAGSSPSSPGEQVKTQALNRLRNRRTRNQDQNRGQGPGDGQDSDQDGDQGQKPGRARSAAAGRQAISKSVTAGLTSLGVPPPIAAKIGNVVAKYGPKLIVAGLLTGLMFGVSLLVVLFGGSYGDQQPDASAAAIAEIPGDVFDVYQAAGNEHGVPWTVLAGIGQVATQHGSVSPDDLKNYGAAINRNNKTLQTVEGHNVAWTYQKTANYTVCGGPDCVAWPPLGQPTDDGHGTFLLSTEFIDDNIKGSKKNSLNRQADAFAEKIAEIMENVLGDNPGLSDYNSNPDSAEAFWFSVLTDEHMPVVFPQQTGGEYALPICSAETEAAEAAAAARNTPQDGAALSLNDQIELVIASNRAAALDPNNEEELAYLQSLLEAAATEEDPSGIDALLEAIEATLNNPAVEASYAELREVLQSSSPDNPQTGLGETVETGAAGVTLAANPQDGTGVAGLCMTEEEAELLRDPSLTVGHAHLRRFAECGTWQNQTHKHLGWHITVERFDKLCADAVQEGYDIQIVSAWRSPETQNELWAEAVAGYGNTETAARWVARPNADGSCSSHHCTGTAIDIGQGEALEWLREYVKCGIVDSSGELLIIAGRQICHGHERLVRRAELYGFHFPLWWENWHMEVTLNQNEEQLARRQTYSSNHIGEALAAAIRYGGTMHDDPRVDRDTQ